MSWPLHPTWFIFDELLRVKNCIIHWNKDILSFRYRYSAVQSQKVVSAYFTSQQTLPFGFAEQYYTWVGLRYRRVHYYKHIIYMTVSVRNIMKQECFEWSTVRNFLVAAGRFNRDFLDVRDKYVLHGTVQFSGDKIHRIIVPGYTPVVVGLECTDAVPLFYSVPYNVNWKFFSVEDSRLNNVHSPFLNCE